MDTETILTTESKSDAKLMEAVGRRESDAIQEIYKRYESTLRIVIQSVLHDDSETDGTVKTRLQLAHKKLFNQLAPLQEMI